MTLNTSDLRAGDVLVYQANNLVAKLIRKFDNAEVSHAGLYLGDGQVGEALIVGNRILLLSPHPGRVRAEVGSHQFDLHSLGGTAFQQTAQRIHRLLFEEDSEEGARAAAELGFHDIRIAY